MCLRVNLPLGRNGCTWPAAETDPTCASTGRVPYFPYIAQEWAYSTTIHWDSETREFYFIGIVVEWFDRNQSLPTAITFPAQGNDTSTFGSNPVTYRPVPCPVGTHNITMQFLDIRTNVPVELTNETGWLKSAPTSGEEEAARRASDDLCDNQPNAPCGKFREASDSRDPLEYIKLMVHSSRVPPGGVAIKLDGVWHDMRRSGDNYWQPIVGPPRVHAAEEPVTVRVTCSDGPGAVTLETELVPAMCLCSYQDPDCVHCITDIQCPL
eukprot:239752-Chlamydomonas_euryale.AAC.6